MTATPLSQLETRHTAPPNTGGAARQRVRTFATAAGNMVVDFWEPSKPSGEPPLLLIHGWGGTGGYWEDTAAILSQTVRVIVPDLPGTGRSQPVSKAQNMRDQVDTLQGLLEALEIERVQIVGHSMGGAMALLLADRIPEKVDRLVLTSLSFFVTGFQEQVYRAVMGVFRVSMGFRPNWLASVPGVPYMMAQRYFHHVPRDNAPILKQGLLDYLQLDAKTAIACADDAPNKAIPEAGARITAPTLLIACRQDRVMPPENVDYTAEVIENCQVVWIEDCGHLPMVEQPDLYLRILKDFLRL